VGRIVGVSTLRIAQDDAADELLSRDPLALLLGMLFDQHMGGRSSTCVNEAVRASSSPVRRPGSGRVRC
jgi:hypothetical protein